MVGGAFIYFGGETIDTLYRIKIEGENKWGEFSKIMTCEDINSDGFDELFVLVPGYPDYEIPLGKICIYSYKNLTDVKEDKNNIINNFELKQNYPNPFNPATSIRFSLSSRQIVTLKIYDILGSEVVTLVNEEKVAGKYEVNFSATGGASALASGVYIYKIQAGDFVNSKKMILLK